MEVFIDPFLFAIPKDPSPLVIEKYLGALLIWSSEIETNRENFWTANQIVTALEDANQYPYLNNVIALLRPIFGRESVSQAQTFCRACDKVLTTPPFIDDPEICCNQRFYPEPGSTEISPPVILSRLDKKVANALEDTLILMSVPIPAAQTRLAEDMVFASTDLTDSRVHLESCLLDIEPKEPVPCKLVHDWQTAILPQDLLTIAGLPSFWWDTPLALKWMYDKLITDATLQHSHHLPEINAGPKFNKSIIDLHFDNNPSILRAIFAETVKGMTGFYPRFKTAEKNNHHPLKSGVEQIMRYDGATAWRLYITRSTPKIRLHYWLYPDGSIELSLIVVHTNDEII